MRDGHQVGVKDILQVQSGWFVSVGTWAHRIVNTYFPWFWSWLYASTDHGILARITLPLRVPLAARNSSRTLQLLNAEKPDVVITTQTSASAVVAYLKRTGVFNGLFGITFSDYHLHNFWLYPETDFYLVNIPEQAEAMVRQGIKQECIYVCGMTLKPVEPINKTAVRLKLHIPAQANVILVGSGSLGTGIDEKLLARLAVHENWFVVVVCGKNQVIYNQLTRNLNQPNIRVLGFYVPMQELYAIADIFLTKPGGLTVAEGLSFHLPMVITHYLPGQEKLNVGYLTGKGLILDGLRSDIVSAVKIELSQGQLRNRLQGNDGLAQMVDFGEKVQAAVREAWRQSR